VYFRGKAVRDLLIACAVILGGMVLADSPAAAAGLSWPTSLQVTSAVAIQTGAVDPTLASTACWSAGSCVSVGEDDASGSEHPIVVIDSSGAAAQAVVVSVPPGASINANATAGLNSVSCSSAGVCVAVGEYQDTSGVMHGLVVPISRGRVGTASGVTGPGASEQTYLRGVSCPLVGTCVAVGNYGINANVNKDGVIVTITNGTPTLVSTVALPANANPVTPFASVNSVNCWASGYCVAAGQYLASTNSEIYPVVIPILNGVPGAGIEVALPANAYTGSGGQQSVLNGVGCQATGVCVAVGDYVDSSGGSQPLVVPITTAGTPVPAPAIALPVDAAGPTSNDGLNAVSCGPTGACEGVGYYVDSFGSSEPLAISVSGGVVSAGTEVELPVNELAVSGGLQTASLSAVVCPQSGSCLAVGDYDDISGNQQGMVEPIAGVASTSSEALPPATAVGNPDASFNAVACATSASCMAVGGYQDATAQTQAFQYSLQATLTIVNASLPKAVVGSPYSAKFTATGGWNAYKWSIASKRLPAGLSLNAQTGVISGKPRTAATYKFTIRAVGTGGPVQSVTKALSIAVAPKPAEFRSSIPRGGLKLSGKSVSIQVACAKGAAACRGSLSLVYAHEVLLKHHKRKSESAVIGRLSYSLAANRSRTMKIKLTAAGLRFLKGAKKQKLAVVFDATVKGANSSSKNTTLGVAAIAKKKK
jgi:Putative Ig domain